MMNSLRVTTGQSCPIDYNEKSFRYSGGGCKIPERFKFPLHSHPCLFIQVTVVLRWKEQVLSERLGVLVSELD